MRISELLTSIASWLESPNNEALLLAEYDEQCLKVVAESCVVAASALKKAAQEVDCIEPPEDSTITPESIEGIAALAAALDASGDPELIKQASVLDELLLTIAAPPNALNDKKAAEEKKIDDIKKKYHSANEELDKTNKIADSIKAIDKSNMTKDYRVLEAPLSTRYCPDHSGVQISRIGEHHWQCELDKKTYNFETGFELNNGSRVPGGDVANQTQGISEETNAIFDTREGRLGTNQP
jgi:hypothetical protein